VDGDAGFGFVGATNCLNFAFVCFLMVSHESWTCLLEGVFERERK
jgi:hypothetical protein